jgi:hypothetical protein
VTGGVSEKHGGARNWKNEMGEGGIVIKSMDVGIGCATQCVRRLPPLLCILGWWGVGRRTPNILLSPSPKRIKYFSREFDLAIILWYNIFMQTKNSLYPDLVGF